MREQSLIHRGLLYIFKQGWDKTLKQLYIVLLPPAIHYQYTGAKC